eukprot:evm.model.scf_53EXC.7 EVM.evm.TU.scf_53EXC.7   scf_53EXC:56769-57668(-)
MGPPERDAIQGGSPGHGSPPATGAAAPMPFSCLWFPGPEDEAAFADWYAANHFRPIDRVYHRLAPFLSMANAWGRLQEDGVSWSAGAAALSSAMTICITLLWFVWRVDDRPRLRENLAVINRISVGSMPLVVMAPLWCRDPAVTLKGLGRFMALNIVGLVYLTAAAPILTWHHILVQVPTVVLMCLRTPQQVCSAITPGSAPFVRAAWGWLSAVSTGGAVRLPTPSAEHCCVDIVVMCYFALGLCLPSYILWAAEFRARMAFRPGAAPAMAWGTVAVHGALMATALSCVWVFLHPGAWL